MIKLESYLKKEIENEICKAILDLKFLKDSENLKRENYDDILLFLSIMYNYEINIIKDNDDFIHNLISTILQSYKKELEENNYEKFFLCGWHSGIGSLVYSLNILGRKHKGLESFTKYINDIFISMVESYSEYVKKEKEKLKFSHYDAIVGISGYLYNIIKLFPNDYQNLKGVLTSYLVELSEDIDYKNSKIIGYHIKCENQYLASEREFKKDGHINFGLAHGIVGPLVALTKVKSRGDNIPDLDNAIYKLKKLYEEFEKKDTVLKYPTQLSYNSYLNNIFLEEEYSFNASWCYGNLGIVRVLMIVSLNLQDKDKYEYYKNGLIDILNQRIESYNFNSSCLCHGYASAVTIQLSAFFESRDFNILESLEKNVVALIGRYRQELLERKDLRYDFSLIDGRGGIIATLLALLVSDISFKDIILI
jgi:lanthionine synthetase C-like protein